MLEFARIIKPISGRVILLTAEDKIVKREIKNYSHVWNLQKLTALNMGGVDAWIFVMNKKGPVDLSAIPKVKK